MTNFTLPDKFKELNPKQRADIFLKLFFDETQIKNITDSSIEEFKGILDKRFNENSLSFIETIKDAIIQTIEVYFNNWILEESKSWGYELSVLFPEMDEDPIPTKENFISTCIGEVYNYIRAIFRYKLMVSFASQPEITKYLLDTYGIDGKDINKFH